MKHLALASFCLLFVTRCTPGRAEKQHAAEQAAIAATPADPAFGDYWYNGTAEITTYNLEQPRYGEVRQGKAVLIFVTEPFSRAKHVKLDNHIRDADDAVTVLKLNRVQKFTTGIYPYFMMSSVFTPIAGDRDPRTFKLTTTSQEWCGHSFVQFDLQGNQYHIQHHSYFESDADHELTLPGAILEDELWSKIRIDPSSLPTGEVNIIAGTVYRVLSRRPYMLEHAKASFGSLAGDDLLAYTVAYDRHRRTLTIFFETDFPHSITGWNESYSDRDTTVTIRARRDRSMNVAYWNRTRLTDEVLRAELGLD